MTMEKLQSEAALLASAKNNPGFDSMRVTASSSKLIGVRIAQSMVCRENVFNERCSLNIAGAWQGRESEISVIGSKANDAQALSRQLLSTLKSQSENKEYCAPKRSSGSFRWDVAKDDFESAYSPEILYPVIEKYAAKVRKHGLRLTGYIECEEKKSHSYYLDAQNSMDLAAHDHGMSFSITIDNERTGAVGSTQRAAVKITRAGFDQLFSEAVDDALNIALTSEAPAEIAPGDYTVILHPACVNDIVLTSLMYGMFDQRKIDEGRTWLSKTRESLRFAEGFYLHQDLSIDLPGFSYRDSPFNRDGVECESIRLIDDARVTGTHVSRYWAKQTGLNETFSAWDGPPLICGAKSGSPLAGNYKTLNDLIAGTENGIYICNTWYLRMVAEMEGVITGMTRDGIFEIRDGKILRPVKNMRWHDNPFRILSAIDAVTDSGMAFGRSRLAGRSRLPLSWMPAARVQNFHFSSATKF